MRQKSLLIVPLFSPRHKICSYDIMRYQVLRRTDMGKTFMKNTVIKSELREADGAKYRYSLIVSESNKVASYKLPLYSVEIEMTDKDGNVTNARTRELFADVGKAISFFRKLSENLATPLNLPYILEDEMQ